MARHEEKKNGELVDGFRRSAQKTNFGLGAGTQLLRGGSPLETSFDRA